MKLCKCGCGQPTKGHLDHGDHGKFVEVSYLRGHSSRGRKATPETIQRLKDSHKGKVSQNKGKIASSELREKLRIAHMGQIPAMKGKKHSLQSIEKMRIIKMGKRHSLQTKEKMRVSRMGKSVSSEARKKISLAHKRNWLDPTYAETKIKAWRITPNKQEMKLMETLDLIYPNEWKFVGDGQVCLAGRCPDFINVNGQKKIIELFGDYWHRGENPQDRIDIFKPFGFDTLVIWERELKDIDSLKNKIERFCDQ